MQNISYQLLRQKRKTLSITVVDGSPVIKAPLKLPQEKIDEFILLKTDWISAKIETYYKKYYRFSNILNGKVFLINGIKYESQWVKAAKITLQHNVLLIPITLQFDSQKFAKSLKRFFITLAKEKLFDRVTYLQNILEAKITTVSLSNASTRWGSCDSKKNIRLNWRLILLPLHMQDYVIIHELCHSFYLNHSQNFWMLVSKYIPNYKNLRSELKDFSLIIKYLKH